MSKIKNLHVFSVLLLIAYSQAAYGAKTVCGAIFYTDGSGISSLQKNLLTKCNEAINGKDGCLSCVEGTVNGQYQYEEKVSYSRICWISKEGCETTNSNAEQEFETFFKAFEQDDQFNSINTVGILVKKKVVIEKEENIPDNAIELKLITHQRNSITYTISSTVKYPIQCYKGLFETDSTEKELYRNDTYVVIKPEEKNLTFSENLPNFDCKSYEVNFKCYPIPYQYTVSAFKEFKQKIKVNHTKKSAYENNNSGKSFEDSGQTDTVCSLVESNEELKVKDESGKEQEELPSLSTEDPMESFANLVETINEKSSEEKIKEFNDMKSSTSSDISNNSTFTGKLNVGAKINQVVGEVSCEETATTSKEACEKAKTELEDELWNELDKVLNKGDIKKNLGSGSKDYEINIKITLQIIIVSSNNNQYLSSSSSDKILDTTSKVIGSSKEILEELSKSTDEDKDEKINDIISLMTSAASSTFQLSQNEKIDGESKKIIDYSGKNKKLYKSIMELSRTLIRFNKRSTSTNYYTFLFSPVPASLDITVSENETARRLLEEDNKDKDKENEEEEEEIDLLKSYNSYSYDDVEVSVPLEYIRSKKGGDEIGLAIFSYNIYPLVTTKGLKKFSQKVISIDLVKNTTSGVKSIGLGLPGDLPIKFRFKNSSSVSNFTKCYRYSPGSFGGPTFDQVYREPVNYTNDGELLYDKDYIECASYKFGDFLIGEYNPGITGVGIFFIVIIIINLIAWCVIGYLIYKKYYKPSGIEKLPSDNFSEKVRVEEKTTRISSRSNANVLQSESNMKGNKLNNVSKFVNKK